MTSLEILNLLEGNAPSWDGWREVFHAVEGLRPNNLAFWNKISGNRPPLTERPSEIYAAFGRGAGKSQAAAMIAASVATQPFTKKRWIFQRRTIAIFAPNQRQAAETFFYVKQIFEHPQFAPLVTAMTQNSIDLKSGYRVEVLPADPKTARSRAYALVILEEASFFDNDSGSARQDLELVRSVRPALGRVAGSLLLVISSKYARRGVLWEASKHFGKPGDTLYLEAGTLDLNPTFSSKVIEKAYQADPVAAASEYGTEWRADVSGVFTPEVLQTVITLGRHELPPMPHGISYRAFLDFSGGSGSDSATCAIAHTDKITNREILDAVREVRPPFSPDTVCQEFATFIRSYGVSSAQADRWGGSFPSERMQQYGVTVTAVGESKSELYGALLPLINSGMVELLDHERLKAQLIGLERRTARGGGSSIDHGPGSNAHDDVANAVAGALVIGRVAAGVQYRISNPMRGVGSREMPRQARAEREAQQRELDQMLPKEIRSNSRAVLALMIDENPACTLPELQELWTALHRAGALPAWSSTIQSQAEQELFLKGQHEVLELVEAGTHDHERSDRTDETPTRDPPRAGVSIDPRRSAPPRRPRRRVLP